MITFLTLLLGLATGIRPVEVAVGPGITTVEVSLDGRTVATLTGTPWKIPVDLGPEPEPHELLAIGRDARGAEVARARQMVNMPRQAAEASLILLPGSGGRARRALLSWQSAIATLPERIAVTFDGRLAPLDSSHEIALPDYIPEQVHFLRAELGFPGNLMASAEIVFGGRDVDETRAELTGIPAIFKRPKSTANLEGIFLADGKPARVSAVEEGPGEIVVVRDERARIPLILMTSPAAFIRPMAQSDPRSLDLRSLDLRPGQRLRFCWPVTRPVDEVSEGYDVFMRSGDFDSESGGLDRLLTFLSAPAFSDKPRFADAISVAALSASGQNRARAVLFLYGGSPDASKLSPEVVRRYLAKLRVPLYVWAVDGPSARKAERWGEVTSVRTNHDFLAAGRKLVGDVAAQRIVWVDGVHLPQAITLSAKAAGIRIAE